MPGRGNCTDCGSALAHNPRRLGTRCKPCNARAIARSPETRRIVAAKMTARWADDKQRGKLVAAITKTCNRPEIRAARQEQGRRDMNVVRFAKPAPPGSPSRIRAGRTLRESRIGWCPMEYRAEYQRMRDNGNFTAAEARRIIEDQIERDLDRYIATGRLQRSEVAA